MKVFILACLSVLLYLPFATASTLEDVFTVKSIEGQTATVEGKANGLKAGDQLYFARSPFHFTVTDVKGDKITISLPTRHDLSLGNTLIRTPTPAMKKAIDTEDRLKKALED